MKRYLSCLIAVLVGIFAQTLHAEEPFLQLIDAMRTRGFSDTALDYIEELRTRNNLPADVKARLSFEEFKVHQQSARLAKTIELKQAALEKALASAYVNRGVDKVDYPLIADKPLEAFVSIEKEEEKPAEEKPAEKKEEKK